MFEASSQHPPPCLKLRRLKALVVKIPAVVLYRRLTEFLLRFLPDFVYNTEQWCGELWSDSRSVSLQVCM